MNGDGIFVSMWIGVVIGIGFSILVSQTNGSARKFLCERSHNAPCEWVLRVKE